jgi:N,N'-diacetyllegionaminate synthase
LRIAQFDTDKEVLVVAEIGNNHEGDYSLAERLVGLAAQAGAHAVKFQTFKTELFVSRKEEARFRQLKSYELTFGQFERLSELAKAYGLLFISTPFDLESALFLKDIVTAYKIASGDNTFYPLLKTVASTGLPVIMSGGLADVSQLQHSKGLIEKVWKERGIGQSLAILHCVTAYPVPSAEANLGAIEQLRKELGCTIGYSDHTLGTEAAVLATALGARIIEKHFTIDKHYSAFRDHQLSADPEEMSLLVRRIKEVGELLGSSTKAVQESEKRLAHAVRRSIVAKRDLPKGTVLSQDDLMWTRPANGLPPGDEQLLLGKTLSVAVSLGEPILAEYVIDTAHA